MNKGKIMRLLACCTACLSVGVITFAGCKKDNGHSHAWSGYISDGESGHHRVSICLDHATVKENITAHDAGDVCAKCGFVKGVNDETVAVTKVTVSGDTSVKVGGKITLTATVSPENATHKTVVWSIESGAESAEIGSSSGILTGKAKGSITVKATAGGVSCIYAVEVTEASAEAIHVTGVTLDKGELTMTVGGADQKLNATVKPDNADDKTYRWSSDKSTVATVADGVVHAVGAGTANITVTTNDGNKTATCKVTVKSQEPGKDPSNPSEPIEKPDDPVISGPVQGGVKITKASAGALEAAYVEWTAADNAKWYNVYCSPEGADNWTKIDAPLVRQYRDYFRADAVGLKAGSYDMKVVPVAGDGTEAADYGATAEKIAVYAHERSGYAFVNNTTKATASGAYNMDGTLRDDAIVLYVTQENYKTVSVTYNGVTVTGIDNILGEGYQSKKGAVKPLCVRFIGSIGDGSQVDFKANGDLELKGLDQGVTLEGIGNDATANGWGFHITGCSNVEIRNFGIMNMMGGTKDGIGFEGNCHHVWVHNCDIFYGHKWSGDQVKGDGALDTKKSTYVTHSYNHFWDCGKCNLQGMKESGDFRITYHHNWYDHSDSRHPRIRSATVHIYNNYFDGNAKYGVGVTMGASAFVENNYFRSTAAMRPMMSSGQGTDALGDGTFSGEAGGMIKAFGNIYDCSKNNLKLLTQNDTAADNIDCYEASSRTEKVPAGFKTKVGGTVYNNFDTADDMYEYSVDTPEQAKAKVEKYAGRVDGGDLKFDFDDATQDSNYDIIPELSNLLIQYSKGVTLVKIGKDGE